MESPMPVDPTLSAKPPASPRGLGGHLAACASGAALDNLLKQAVTVALVGLAWKAGTDPGTAESDALKWSTWVLGLFLVPFVLLAPLAGSLGDRLPKHLLIRAARLADGPVLALGIYGMLTGNPVVMLAAVTGLAVISAMFAPVKLAVVPELVTGDRLTSANAWLAATTVVAILLGTCATAVGEPAKFAEVVTWLGSDWKPGSHAGIWALAAIGSVLVVIGIIGAWQIPPLTAADRTAPLTMPWMIHRQFAALNHPGLWAPALGLAGFWALGGVAMVTLPAMAKGAFDFHEAGTVGLFLALVLGIVAGSALAPRYHVRSFPAGLPIIGAILAGIALACAGIETQRQAALPAESRNALGVAWWLVLCGIGAGAWEVALTVLVQERSPERRRNLIMAAVGVLGSLGALIATALVRVAADHHYAAPAVLIATGLAAAVLAGFCLLRYRHQVAGWFIAMLVRIAYHVRVVDAQHLPTSGGCLVVCNHLSFSDGLVLACHLPRLGRFLVYRRFVQMPVVGFFLRAAGVIPVAAEDSRRALLASIDAAVESAKAGEVVVIFPEGKLTRSGQMDIFRSGLERIATRAGVPVVPAHLLGLWGTVSSRAPSRRWPRPMRPIELRVGAPLPPTTTAAQARTAVTTLSYAAAQARSDRDHRTLGAAFLSRLWRKPWAQAVRDQQGVLSRFGLAAAARALQPLLTLADDERTVGLLLPPGRAGAIANLALALMGRTAVNLNHTAGPAQLKRMCEMARIRTVISATPYLKRIGDPGLATRLVMIDDLLKQLGKLDLLASGLLCLLLPSALISRARSKDAAAIVFSSGSTGDPKGVELTHRQVLANIRAVEDGLDVHDGRDVVLSPLPLFHSFGLMPGMWLGLSTGIGIAAHPDPTDGKVLGELAVKSGATFLISTPTFARGYLRRTEAAHFRTLRFAVVGAERCPAELKQQFKERFGTELLEGYGCTELAPVVALNLPAVKRDGVTEIRAKDGAVGRALPGIQVFAIHPDTRELLPPGQEGLLVVQSPGRMRGYLDREDLTDKAFFGDGYITGDIGRVDEEGFIQITGRLSRFAKIAGEMVPLDNVETAVRQALNAAIGVDTMIEVAVSAVPDEARGERLVVLHTGHTGDWEELFATLDQLPALWRPRSRDVRKVPAIPKLGTGKVDLAALKALARDNATTSG